MLPVSLFDQSGIDVGTNPRNMTYLYGLSDFFSYVFEDTETVNVLLEANAISASDIYSHFLQITSSLTLSGIQTDVGVTLKLLLVRDSYQEGSAPKYKVDIPISYAKYLTNRPFLPTDILEAGVDFKITQIDTKSCYIEFARPLDDYLFSKRPTTTGENEYAIWATDIVLDESLMYKQYGEVLNLNEEISSEQFSNFVYGLYYLYLNGPTLQVMEQGLNLVLGIPLVRRRDVVIDIRYNIESDQYIVITETDSYLLPAGIPPIVNIDDVVDLEVSLAKWIELKDFISSGKWWHDVSIPVSVVRPLPGNQPDRFAREGTNYDYIMSNYLFKNTFLVRITVGGFKANKYFSYLSNILYNAKPAYTLPVYIWKISLGGSENADPDSLIPSLYEDSLNISSVVGRGASALGINYDSINYGEIN